MFIPTYKHNSPQNNASYECVTISISTDHKCGRMKGAGPRIQRKYCKATYFWGASHQLSRAMVFACEIPQVKNDLGITYKVSR